VRAGREAPGCPRAAAPTAAASPATGPRLSRRLGETCCPGSPWFLLSALLRRLRLAGVARKQLVRSRVVHPGLVRCSLEHSEVGVRGIDSQRGRNSPAPGRGPPPAARRRWPSSGSAARAAGLWAAARGPAPAVSYSGTGAAALLSRCPDARVRELAAVAEHVHRRGADAEQLGDLAHRQQRRNERDSTQLSPRDRRSETGGRPPWRGCWRGRWLRPLPLVAAESGVTLFTGGICGMRPSDVWLGGIDRKLRVDVD
jgi:hypothetical protein